MEHENRRQLSTLAARRSRKTVYPTDREVLLACLLLEVCEHLDWSDTGEGTLYDDVKHIAEGIVRNATA